MDSNKTVFFALAAAAATIAAGSAPAQTKRVSVLSGGVQLTLPSYHPSISNDGNRIVFEHQPGNGASRIWVHDCDAGTTQDLATGNGHSNRPDISGDGTRVGFFSRSTNLIPGQTINVPQVYVIDLGQSGSPQLVSQSAGGVAGTAAADRPVLSESGGHVAFDTASTNLVTAQDLNAVRDVFARDLTGQTTVLISRTPGGAAGNGRSQYADISATGRYIVFESTATDLRIAGDFNGFTDIYVRDRDPNGDGLDGPDGENILISVNDSGQQADNSCTRPTISADGRFVAFQSAATNLFAGPTPSRDLIYVRDRDPNGDGFDGPDGQTILVSRNLSNQAADFDCGLGRISADGTCVAFWSAANNLLGTQNHDRHVYLRELGTDRLELVSVSSFGLRGNDDSGLNPADTGGVAIDARGHAVAFYSTATNLVPGDTNTWGDVFVRDTSGLRRCYAGDSPGDRYGSAVANAGDVDGDGIDDVIVGAPNDDDGGQDAGSAEVISGATGAVLHRFDGGAAGDHFGAAVAGAGDVDGDGLCDLIVGAPDAAGGSGGATVFRGSDGSVLHTIPPARSTAGLGFAVDGAGDVNGDGYDDFVVGEPFFDGDGTDAGRVRVYSGVDAGALHTLFSTTAGDEFGYSVAGAGDVDCDGFDDVIVGVPGDSTNGADAGRAVVYSGQDGRALRTFLGDSAGDRFGSAVDGAGDVDLDDHADLIVGAPCDDDGGTESGTARIFDGDSGAIRLTLNGAGPFDHFGSAVAGAGDFDGDERADVIVGAPDDDNAAFNCGRVTVFSAHTGTALFALNGEFTNDHLGAAVDGGMLANADCLADIVVGTPLANSAGPDAGSACVILNDGAATPGCHRFRGAACPGSDGRLPHIGIRGRPTAGNAYHVSLRAVALPFVQAVLNIGFPFDFDLGPIGMPGCTALVRPIVSVDAVVDANRRAVVTMAVPNDPTLIGVVLHHQWLAPDPGANVLELVASNALIVTLGGGV